MPQERLIEELLRVAADADSVASHVARVEELPTALVAGILDRIKQLTSLIRLLAREVSLATGGEAHFDIPLDG